MLVAMEYVNGANPIPAQLKNTQMHSNINKSVDLVATDLGS